MGNDMFNDEQLAYAEIVQKVTEDALGFWKDRALKAEAERDALLAKAAPPADAATEALRYCEEVFQHNEINRVDGEEIADRALVLIRRALSAPAPAPSADPWRACGCADPDNCEHIFRDPAPSADAAPLTSDFHTSCDWCKRDIPNACYAVLCSDCDRRGNTALFAPPADAAETPGTNKVEEASDGDRDHKGADLKQDGGGNAADGEGPALLGVPQADGALPDGAAGRVLLAVSVLRGGAADRSVAPPADAATAKETA